MPAQIVWTAAIPASFYNAITGLRASCNAAGACGAAYGDLAAKFLVGVDADGAGGDRDRGVTRSPGRV